MLFTGAMVKALLDGSKTETRRLQGLDAVNDHPDKWSIIWQGLSEGGKWQAIFKNGNKETEYAFSKIQPADTIWCKETFGLIPDDGGTVVYRATDQEWGTEGDLKWKPSIFMRREYSRISLRVKEVRVERLRDIGKDGRKAVSVLAEGITREQISHWQKWLHPDDAPAHTYGALWDSINENHPWASNPWVWVYRFERIKP